jgi:hypothetical protein
MEAKEQSLFHGYSRGVFPSQRPRYPADFAQAGLPYGDPVRQTRYDQSKRRIEGK